MRSLIFASLVAFESLVHALPTEECPLLGPTYPVNFDLTKTDAFLNATEQFPQVIDQLFAAGALVRANSSFTIDVYSTITNTSIYSYSNDAEILHSALTTGTLDENTIFRIGSVSKIFTVYAILAKAGYNVLEDPVTKYLPELAGNDRTDVL